MLHVLSCPHCGAPLHVTGHLKPGTPGRCGVRACWQPTQLIKDGGGLRLVPRPPGPDSPPR